MTAIDDKFWKILSEINIILIEREYFLYYIKWGNELEIILFQIKIHNNNNNNTSLLQAWAC